MEAKIKKTLKFSEATYKKLKKIANIKQVADKTKFQEWFSYQYKISKEEESFLNEIIDRNELTLNKYNEPTLVAKFIVPLLNKVNFNTKEFRDWYQYKISCEINGWKLTGHPDYFVASGFKEPEIPFFFIHEFKPTKSVGFPDDQLIAELLVAINLNKTTEIKGGYVADRHWYFVILEKLKNGNYQYYVSKSYDGLNIDDLKKIYTYLQAVKFNYCK